MSRKRKPDNQERMREFIREALAAGAAVAKSAPVYRADYVHGWIMQLAQNRRAARLNLWRNQLGLTFRRAG